MLMVGRYLRLRQPNWSCCQRAKDDDATNSSNLTYYIFGFFFFFAGILDLRYCHHFRVEPDPSPDEYLGGHVGSALHSTPEAQLPAASVGGLLARCTPVLASFPSILIWVVVVSIDPVLRAVR